MTDHTETAAPEGYATVTPWVITDDTAAFTAFAVDVFEAWERFPPITAGDPEDSIAHAEIQIGDSVIMAFDRRPGWAPTPAFLNVFVADCDKVHRRALERGAVEVTQPATNAWGARGSRVRDPFGNLWWIQAQVEDLSDEEAERRMGISPYREALEDAMTSLDAEMRSR